jgi:outer membrane lipoprotein carrier protein
MRILKFLCWMWFVSISYALAPHNLLIQKFNGIHTMDANFEQSIFMNGRLIATHQGHFILKRPGQVRWTIQKPQKQEFISNGQKVWVYEPGLKQATVRDANQGIAGSAGLFLSDQPNFWIQRYKVTVQQDPSMMVFLLKAKTEKTPFIKVLLGFEKDKLARIEFWDQLGQYSVVRLRQVKINGPLPANIFEFKPPKNTDVIHL